MAPSFDCFANLLCTEDISIFDENEFGDSMEMLEEPWNVEYEPNLNQTQQFDDPIGLLPLLSDESLKVMIEKECHHLPASDYVNRLKIGVLDLEGRMDAIDWIQKVRVHFGFGPLCVYLAVNYMDRFLSACETLKERLWSIQLLAVGCVYLAAKIEETTVPPSLDLQVNETKYLFDTKTILRMELMIMSTLKWRMQAITPFSFIDYFLYKVNNDQVPTGDSILQSIQLILSTMRGIDFIQFRPSEIAAAVAVLVSMVGENQTVETEKAVSLLIQYVEKERVMKCVEMIQQLSSGSDSAKKDTTTSASVSVPCVPQSPIGVLEPLCLSYKSDENNTNVATSPHANPSLHNDMSPDPKRKKLNKTIED